MATWNSPVSGNWNVAANWSTDAVPTSVDGATIVAPGPYTVTISSPDQANVLLFDAPQAQLIENAGSLTLLGTLQVHSGFVSLNEANTLNGTSAATVQGGVLAFGNAGALGAGTVSMTGGELLATTNETMSNALVISGTSTIAAARGTTLIEDAVTFNEPASSTLNIGSPGDDGTILWEAGERGGGEEGGGTVDVQAGTLKQALSPSGLSALLGSNLETIVAASATVDAAGLVLEIANLTGAGTVTDSGVPTTLTLDAANFSGSISGPLSLTFNEDTVLSGLEDYTGSSTVAPASSVTNNGIYELVANNNINGASSATFTNNVLFKKTGGGGVSDVRRTSSTTPTPRWTC